MVAFCLLLALVYDLAIVALDIPFHLSQQPGILTPIRVSRTTMLGAREYHVALKRPNAKVLSWVRRCRVRDRQSLVTRQKSDDGHGSRLFVESNQLADDLGSGLEVAPITESQ